MIFVYIILCLNFLFFQEGEIGGKFLEGKLPSEKVIFILKSNIFLSNLSCLAKEHINMWSMES